MVRNEEYFLNELQKDVTLYSIFNCIGEYSTIYHEEINFMESKQVKLKDIIDTIKSHVVNKSENVIQIYIDILIKYGLCEYVIENDKNDFIKDIDKRLEYYKDLGYPKENTEIKLTQNAHIACSGVVLYKRIISDKQSEKFAKEFEEEFKLEIEKIIKPYNDRTEKLTSELEDKISEMNRVVDSGVIKNIQVISVFAGIISLLFANIIGLKEFSNIGIRGMLILNSSMIMAILALIIFTKILIIGGEIKGKYIFYCLLIILFSTIPIIFC